MKKGLLRYLGLSWIVVSVILPSYVYASTESMEIPETTKLELEQGEAEASRMAKNWSNKIDVISVKEELKNQGVKDPDKLQISEDGGSRNPAGEVSVQAGQVGYTGDVLVTLDGSSSKGIFNVGHAGIVSNYSSTYTVESFPEGDGRPDGVAHYPNNWAIRYNKVKGMYVSGAQSSHYTEAGKAARSLIGKPYNWVFTDKTTYAKFYCSQLVWRAWINQGWDIDANYGSVVTPSDIINDAHTIAFYSKGF